MFKIKKVEEMKGKIKMMKYAAITFWIIFILMICNQVYLNIKIHKLQDRQMEIINSFIVNTSSDNS